MIIYKKIKHNFKWYSISIKHPGMYSMWFYCSVIVNCDIKSAAQNLKSTFHEPCNIFLQVKGDIKTAQTFVSLTSK